MFFAPKNIKPQLTGPIWTNIDSFALTLNKSENSILDSKPISRFNCPLNGQIAQSVEQRTENPCVAGSIPALATILMI
jgi:hypothetical protein